MALMFAKGELTPMPDLAIFADTQAEPESVYEWLGKLEPLLPYPVIRATKGSLLENIESSVKGGRFAGVPFFTESKRGIGMLRRQCTQEYKLRPIKKALREFLGIGYHKHFPKKKIKVSQCIGISTDESLRMKPAREAWIEHRWPLIEAGMNRDDCVKWMVDNGYPIPSKSACTFCPYHDNETWLSFKEKDPKAWEQAISLDELVRNGVRGTKEKLYLHRSLKPLKEVDFKEPNKTNQFINECEGICGV
jgi:hypothetical protein